jgi:hypothetical protein
MPKNSHLESDRKDAAADARRPAEASVESLFDLESRVRVGELIARAMQAVNRRNREK